MDLPAAVLPVGYSCRNTFSFFYNVKLLRTYRKQTMVFKSLCYFRSIIYKGLIHYFKIGIIPLSSCLLYTSILDTLFRS